MTLPASGRITWSQIRAEFGGGNGRLALSDLYLGGNKVRAKAANAHANVVNKAAGVPTEGRVALSDFYGKEAAFEYTNPGQSSILYAATIFGTDWPESYKKRLINGGTTERIYINEGGGGQIELVNNGEIQGLGGAANAGAGTPALYAYSPVRVTNNGAIRGGGGGGGKGGTGGQGGGGFFDTGGDYREPTTGQHYSNSQTAFGVFDSQWFWNGVRVAQVYTSTTSVTVGNVTYYRGTVAESGWTQNGKVVQPYAYYGIYRIVQNPPVRTYTAGGAGGAGGNGGVGQGYGQTSASGSAGAIGALGGANAGRGGTGGTGGSGGGWGAGGGGGNTGGTGQAGNNGGGQAGASGQTGGPSGRGIIGGRQVMVVTGTINGGIA